MYVLYIYVHVAWTSTKAGVGGGGKDRKTKIVAHIYGEKHKHVNNPVSHIV